jgi:hypothetical protein
VIQERRLDFGGVVNRFLRGGELLREPAEQQRGG